MGIMLTVILLMGMVLRTDTVQEDIGGQKWGPRKEMIKLVSRDLLLTVGMRVLKGSGGSKGAAGSGEVGAGESGARMRKAY